MQEKAGRAVLRPTKYFGISRGVNVSIRTLASDLQVQTIDWLRNYTIDKRLQAIYCAIESTAKEYIDRFLHDRHYSLMLSAMADRKGTVKIIIDHALKTKLPLARWFAGVGLGPRVHPYDERELAYPTKLWVFARCVSAVEAQFAVHQLIKCSLCRSPEHSTSSEGKYVFAYVLNHKVDH